MDDLEAAAVAASGGQQQQQLDQQLANLNLSLVSEDDELRLLNFPASKHEDLSTAIPLTAIFALLLVTGCVGNLCTAIVIARPRNKYMHTATNYYLFSLAMSDFLFLILGLPQEMFTLWQRYPYAFGESFCIIRGYLSEATTYASILTISAFTIERYVAICHPLWAHTMSQLPRAITSIVIIWLLAAVCAIPPAAELGIVTQRTIYENMFVVSAIVFFIVPMIIVTVLYILIAIELRRSSKMNNAITKQSSSGSQQHQHHHHHPALHYSCAGHALGGHLRRASRSHQQIAHTGLGPTNGQQQQRQQEHRPGDETESLMANIMSQRPSSAIGTEHPAAAAAATPAAICAQAEASAPEESAKASAKRGGHLSAFLWPVWLWTSSAPTPISSASGCQQCGQLPVAAAQSQSNLFAASEQHPSQQQQQRVHSPLSYHESLIQRQQSATCQQGQHLAGCHLQAARAAANHHRHPNNSHQPPTHQLSLQHSASGQLGRHHHLAGSQHQQARRHHHHHHHHHHQQHHNYSGGSANRRSAGASSKKSVVRMLVAVVVSFFICWLPFHAQRLLASYLTKDENQNQFLLDLYGKITHISGVLYYLSSTINPLLYQLMSAKFRLAFKETFKCSLFKCFRLQPAASGRSPTNSLKEPHQQQQHHHHHHQVALRSSSSQCAGGCCSCGPAAAGHWAQPQAQSAGADPPLAYATCAACHPTPGADHYPPLDAAAKQGAGPVGWPGGPVGLVSRLRGRMSTTLASLFRLNGARERLVAVGCPNCCCSCPNQTGLAAGPNGHHHQRVARGFVYNQLTSAAQTTTDQLPSCCNPTDGSTAGPASGSQMLRVELTPSSARPSDSSCSANSSPLDHQQQVGAAHTMLKFIRTPSPSSAKQQQQQQIPLSRVSSREEEEQEESPGQMGQSVQVALVAGCTADRPFASEPTSRAHQGAADGGGNFISDNNNNTAQGFDPTLPTSGKDPRHHQMSALIAAAAAAADHDDDDEAREGHGTGSELIQMHSLGMTSESGNSSGSSPDQLLKLSSGPEDEDSPGGRQGAPNASRHHWCANRIIRSGSNKLSSPLRGAQAAPGKRRRSLQQQQQPHYSTNPRSANANRQVALEPYTDLQDEFCVNGGRRESSSSSNTNHKHMISCSELSSSDRQLDKKLSFSTTTSAIDDCGSSFTTTHSHLTGAGSHPTLAQNRDLLLDSSERLHLQRGSLDEAVEEEATVINLHPCDGRLLADIKNETEIPLLAAGRRAIR